MTMRVSSRAGALAGPRAVGFDQLYGLGALVLLLSALSTLLGGIWDIQWHTDVGPDTFFTAPHLMLYLGAGGAGLTSLAVTLLATFWVREGASPDADLVPLARGVFWAPIGFVVAGLGSLLYLLFGLYDLWWHTIYGFDATLDSPPHVGLGLADAVTLGGSVLVFAMLVTRSRDRQAGGRFSWADMGLTAVTAIFLFNLANWQIGFAVTPVGPIDGQLLFIGVCYPVLLMVAASLRRRAGMVTLTTGFFTLLAAGGWLFSSWATSRYAESLGLYVRDNAVGFPIVAAVLPLVLLPVGIAIDLLLVVARRRAWPVRRGVMLAAGVGMFLLVALEGIANRGIYFAGTPDAPSLLATAVAAGLVGAVTGWVGWQLGVVVGNLPRTGGVRLPDRTALSAALIAGLLMAGFGAAETVQAHPGGPVVEVHQETVDVGPYRMEVGFSDWPPRAERSLDIIFHVEEGIAGKSGTVMLTSPTGIEEELPLVRHPRQREDWGLDIIALPEEGEWTLSFILDGPLGPGAGSMALTLGPRPGPPVLVGWLPVLATSAGILAAVAYAWRRIRPARLAETWAWTDRYAPEARQG